MKRYCYIWEFKQLLGIPDFRKILRQCQSETQASVYIVLGLLVYVTRMVSNKPVVVFCFVSKDEYKLIDFFLLLNSLIWRINCFHGDLLSHASNNLNPFWKRVKVFVCMFGRSFDVVFYRIHNMYKIMIIFIMIMLNYVTDKLITVNS